MERLTKAYEDGTYAAADNLPCGENSWKYKNLLLERLGAYEDTGMEPEEVAELKKEYEKSICLECWLKDERNIAKKTVELKGLLESAVEELENVYQRETELTERIREVI